MPTYSFRCRTCGDFDLIAAMSQRPERATCPVCGQLRARVISAPSSTPQARRSIPPSSAPVVARSPQR